MHGRDRPVCGSVAGERRFASPLWSRSLGRSASTPRRPRQGRLRRRSAMPTAPLTQPPRRGERPVRGSRREVGTRDERPARLRPRCQGPVDARSQQAGPTARVPNTRRSSRRGAAGAEVGPGQSHDHGRGVAPLKRAPVWVRPPPGARQTCFFRTRGDKITVPPAPSSDPPVVAGVAHGGPGDSCQDARVATFVDS